MANRSSAANHSDKNPDADKRVAEISSRLDAATASFAELLKSGAVNPKILDAVEHVAIQMEQSLEFLHTQFEDDLLTSASLPERAASSARAGRIFVPISIDQLRAKVDAALAEDEDRNWATLTSKVQSDLNKVSFDTENIDAEPVFATENDIVGYHSLDNGLSFLGVRAGGDWESPVFFIIYWDGKDLRGYIPKDGNSYNTDTMTAYGNDEQADFDNIRKRYPGEIEKQELTVEDIGILVGQRGPLDFNCAKILADIEKRLQPRS